MIADLVQRIKSAHGAYPKLRFSLTLATLANNNGGATAQSLGAGVQDSLNIYGDDTLAAVRSTLRRRAWPSFITVNLMTMDYGSPSAGVCVVSGGTCQMGQSAIQAAYNLRDHFGVPFALLELTPMIGGNDVARRAVHAWRTPTPSRTSPSPRARRRALLVVRPRRRLRRGSASPTCNSMGAGTARTGFSRVPRGRVEVRRGSRLVLTIFSAAPEQELTLGRVLGARDGGLVGARRLRVASQAARSSSARTA